MFEMTENEFNECEQAERIKHDEKVKELEAQNKNLQEMLQATRETRVNADYLKKIAELEAQIEKMKCYLPDGIADLEKENAELKKQLEMSNKVYNDNLDYSHHIEGQLTEAKRLLASWISDKPYTKSELKDLIADTEQFLKDSEVEK